MNQSRLKGGQYLSFGVLDSALRSISKELSLKGDTVVSIAFISPKEMKKLNKQYRGKDGVTDVLSFCYEDEDIVGELLICYEQAKKQALLRKHSVRDEVIFLIVHGLLHLFGHDHENEKDKKKMTLIQARILKKLKINPEW